MSDPELEARLRQLGSAPGPELDRTFADRLDAHLRVRHAELAPVAGPGPARRTRSILAPVAIVTALVLTAAAALFVTRDGDAEVVMTVASDTEVFVGDQPPTDGVPGLVLADGTRIVVGQDGEAVVNGVVLAAGSEAVVIGDRVEVLVVEAVPVTSTTVTASPPPTLRPTTGRSSTIAAQTSRSPATSTTGGSVPTTSTTAPETSRTTSSTTRPTSTSTSATTASSPTSATTAPATTEPPASTRPATTQTTAPPTSDVRADPVTLALTPIGDARIRLDWVLNRDLSPAGWRVRVSRGDRVGTLVVLRGPDARSAVVERSAVDGATVWVEAVDRSGRVLVGSDGVRVR